MTFRDVLASLKRPIKKTLVKKPKATKPKANKPEVNQTIGAEGDLSKRAKLLHKLKDFVRGGMSTADNAQVKTKCDAIVIEPEMSCFRIRMRIRFNDPINQVVERDYTATPALTITDETWARLLEHLRAQTREIMSRDESFAALRLDSSDAKKPRRFSVQFVIDKDGSKCTDTTLVSYQKDPLTQDVCLRLTYELNQMVGEFLVRNDSGFVLPQPEVPAISAPPSVPVFVAHPDEAKPGYTFALCVRNTSIGVQHEQTRTVDSFQPTPFNAAHAEAMLEFTQEFMDATCLSKMRQVDADQTILGQGGFELMFRVRNNLEPRLEDNWFFVKDDVPVFHATDSAGFDMFVGRLGSHLELLRGRYDNQIEQHNDIEVQISELSGGEWVAYDPLTITLGPSKTYNHRQVYALVQRVTSTVRSSIAQTGLKLEVVITKRGHEVCRSTITSDHRRNSLFFACDEAFAREILKSLRIALVNDINLVCRDTTGPGRDWPMLALSIAIPKWNPVILVKPDDGFPSRSPTPELQPAENPSEMPRGKKLTIDTDVGQADDMPDEHFIKEFGYLSPSISRSNGSAGSPQSMIAPGSRRSTNPSSADSSLATPTTSEYMSGRLRRSHGNESLSSVYGSNRSQTAARSVSPHTLDNTSPIGNVLRQISGNRSASSASAQADLEDVLQSISDFVNFDADIDFEAAYASIGMTFDGQLATTYGTILSTIEEEASMLSTGTVVHHDISRTPSPEPEAVIQTMQDLMEADIDAEYEREFAAEKPSESDEDVNQTVEDLIEADIEAEFEREFATADLSVVEEIPDEETSMLSNAGTVVVDRNDDTPELASDTSSMASPAATEPIDDAASLADHAETSTFVFGTDSPHDFAELTPAFAIEFASDFAELTPAPAAEFSPVVEKESDDSIIELVNEILDVDSDTGEAETGPVFDPVSHAREILEESPDQAADIYIALVKFLQAVHSEAKWRPNPNLAGKAIFIRDETFTAYISEENLQKPLDVMQLGRALFPYLELIQERASALQSAKDAQS